MFAIIDIETTGGSAERSKITEICILIHDGLTVVDKFSTLINPEQRIPQMITRLTGIDDEMVEKAPKFFEVAKKIVEMTEGMIFVAHNVGFDYSFVKKEFKSLGYNYTRDKLCTVKLSRKLIPGRKSYSLGPLCEFLGIGNDARHRAAGDAEATAKLFDILLQKKSEHVTYRRQNISEISTTRVDKIKLYVLKRLPEETGVYYFLDKAGDIIYIGKSNNMRGRAMAHFNTQDKRKKQMLYELTDVDFVKTGSELIALLLESEEIKKHRTKYNRARRKSVFTHSIDWFTDEEGIINYKIVPYDESETPVMSFTSHISARERLNEWIDEHILCYNYCGLNADGGECFHHPIKRCYGICCGEEVAEDYNLRAKRITDEFLFPEKNFLILDKGHHNDEQSIILIENGHYAGYGYFDVSDPVTSPQELRAYVKKTTFYPDADALVRWYLKRNWKVKKVVF
ncbi:exonuclease domain-containing protein [soil metagenome]